MNYLAHFHLAERLAGHDKHAEEGLLVGALLGDYVKGPLRGAYPSHWEDGIWLHRRIDALTDSHPLVKECVSTLPGEYRRFGGIMMDVCFDHCLSRDWPDHDHRPLPSFTRYCYDALLAHREHFPAAAQRQIGFLAQHDILSMVAEWHNVEIMLERIGRRLKGANPLDECGPALLASLPTIEAQFRQLYAQLRTQLTEELALRRAGD